MDAKSRIGIDLGGTKTAVIAFDRDDYILFEQRTPTPKNDYSATLMMIGDLVDAARRTCDNQVSIGIGIPGSISPHTGTVQNANSTWLNGQNLSKDLESILGQPVRLANDANCLALSEHYDGAGYGFANIMAVIIGTGCGAGLILNNKLYQGKHAIGGEWGHTPLPWATSEEHPGKLCWCGQYGCLETWVSGSGLERDFALTNNIDLSAQEIEQKAISGDAGAIGALDKHCNRLARGLAMVTNIIDPDVIVFGGGLSNMPHLYKQLSQQMQPFVFADHFRSKIVLAKHGDASGVRGAARLWE